MLHALTGFEKSRMIWCGPSAMSIITGRRYDAMLDTIKHVTGKKTIKGVEPYNISVAFRMLGWIMNPVDLMESSTPLHRLTVAAWIKSRNNEDMNKIYILVISNGNHDSGHYVAIQGNVGADNHTIFPVDLSDFPHRRRKVFLAYEMTKMNFMK